MRINVKKTAVAAAAFGLVEIGAFSWVRADEVTIFDAQDATLLGGSDADNSLADPGIFVGTDGDGNPKRGLIEFNIAGAVPAGAMITGVQLQLVEGQYAGMGGGGTGGTSGPETISLYDESQAWGQPTNIVGATSFGGTGHGRAPDPGDATWNYSFYGTTMWTTAGGDWTSSSADIADASVTGSLTSFTWSSAAMVTDVQNWLDDPAGNFGWILKNADETDIRTFRAFWSAEGAAANHDSSLAPELLVSYTANLTWNNTGGATPSDGQTWDINNNKNWSDGSSPNTVYSDGSNVTFNDANNATANGGTDANAYNVTLNTLVAPTSVTVNNSLGNYIISGNGTIGGTGSLTKSGTGTLTLSTPNTYGGGTNVTGGKLLIEPTGPTSSALARGALSISGGTVQLADNVTAGTALAASNMFLTSLSITGNGTLDIGNNRIIVDYSSPATDPIASIAAWIHDGAYGLGGPSIISSDVATDDAASGLSYGIGYADGADGAVAGLPSGEIEIMFTLLGDANLDGTVNTEDFTPFSTNLGQNGGWDKGDFNYDGTVNTEDFTPFSTNLNQSAVLAASAGVLRVASVPEPVGLSLIAGFAPIFLCRRRRRSAFTFVHCLVVVAIVALMVALLVPTMERLREQSNLALCKDNLRRIGGALILYAHANGGELPVSPTIENPHSELLDCLAAGKLIGDPKIFYCPSERGAGLSFSDQNVRSGIVGYYYYSAINASTDPALSKFLRGEVSWPRKVNAAMDPKTWVMSDIWVSALPTAHAGYRKGVNYLMLDGTVGFVGESPRQQFH